MYNLTAKITHRIAAMNNCENEVTAVTKEQFDKWDSAKRRQYLKDHPTSKFGKNGDGAALRKNSRDPNTTRIKRTVPKGKHLNKLHPGQSQYHFTDTNGNKHTYSSRKEVERHHARLGKSVARVAKGSTLVNPALHQRVKDHHDALTKLLRNKTFNQEHPKT